MANGYLSHDVDIICLAEFTFLYPDHADVRVPYW